MKFGYFDDQNKEYVITSPKTPLPWINYLGCESFFSLISNTGGGYSFYKDAKLLRLTRYRYNNVPYDNNGRYPLWLDICQYAERIALDTRTIDINIAQQKTPRIFKTSK